MDIPMDKVIAGLTALMRKDVAVRWPDVRVRELDDLQVVKLFNEIARERDTTIVATGSRA